MNKDRLAGVVARVNHPGFDECVASGQSCSYGPNGARGEMQCQYCGKPKARPGPGDEQDETTEALRRALNKLPRYSFLLDASGSVRRVPDRSGRWIDWNEAHELFDPVVVDALRGKTR